MPQHDYDIANGSGAAFRADLNAVLAAIASTNKGPAAPTAAQAGMLWVEDDNPSATQWTVRMFDGADWIAIGVLDAATNTFAPANALLTTGGTLTGALTINATSALTVPVGTTAQRPTSATGQLRFNTTTTSFEGFNGTAWGSIGGGAVGGGTERAFYLNDQTISTNYSIPSGQNAGTFGPVTVASGAVVTVPSGSTWTVV